MENRQIIIENDRDKRTYDWLIRTVGKDKIIIALNKLHQNKKPYLTNIIKILGLKVPNSVLQTPKSIARKKLNEILDSINKRQ